MMSYLKIKMELFVERRRYETEDTIDDFMFDRIQKAEFSKDLVMTKGIFLPAEDKIVEVIISVISILGEETCLYVSKTFYPDQTLDYVSVSNRKLDQRFALEIEGYYLIEDPEKEPETHISHTPATLSLYEKCMQLLSFFQREDDQKTFTEKLHKIPKFIQKEEFPWYTCA